MESGRGKLDFDCGSCKVEGPNFSLINYEVRSFSYLTIILTFDVCDRFFRIAIAQKFSFPTIHTLGRTSLSLSQGNMVVARQILLIFNLSYLPCSVQIVNKNYCHAKNDLFTTR